MLTASLPKVDSFPIFKDFSGQIGDITKCVVFVFLFFWYSEMGWHLEDRYNSVSLYFSNDQYVVFQNHASVKDPFKVQEKPVHFSVTQ